MRIRDILREKGPTVITIAPELPLQEALQVLAAHNIGALVVFDGNIRGIISERDLLRRAARDLSGLARAQVRDAMTADVVTASPDADIRDVMDIMTVHRIRHLPVLEGANLVGIISIGDVVNALRNTVESENRFLHAYIHGQPL
jgi:CBS domain-containing protein